MQDPATTRVEPTARPNVPVAVAVAPNGGRRTKADHPALPMTPAELADAAARSLEAGAAMIHLHVRGRDGRHLLDADAYRQATVAVRSAVGDRLVVQITTEAVGLYDPPAQMAVVRAVRPEAASLALRELAPDREAEPAFCDFLGWLARERVMPQVILYSAEDAGRLADLIGRGLVPFDRLPVLYVLGRYTAGQVSAPADLVPFLAQPFHGSEPWMACAFGPDEARCTTAAALLGGDVRVGFENNLHLPDGRLAPDNPALVGATAAMIRATGLSLASADDLRARWSAGEAPAGSPAPAGR